MTRPAPARTEHSSWAAFVVRERTGRKVARKVNPQSCSGRFHPTVLLRGYEAPMPLFRRHTQVGNAAGRHDRSRGQSFVEFAIVLPVMLLLCMTALDFGRAYLGWINLQNMVRAAANFAANNPTAWLIPNETATITRYQNQVRNDAAASNCQLNPATPAAPTFSDTNGDGTTTEIGDHATVNLTCRFQVITPIISSVLGGTVNLSAAAVFPIKKGLTGTGGGTGCILPVPAIDAEPTTGSAPLDVEFSDASGGGAGTSWLWGFGDPSATVDGVVTPTSTQRNPGTVTYPAAGTYTVTLTVTNPCGTVTTDPGTSITVGTPANTCTVPILDGLKRNKAQGAWGLPKPPGAGFTTTVRDGPGAPSGNGWTIVTQSIVALSIVDCGSTIFVNDH
jgi:Flp pilus assembly protein TadG